MLGQDVQMFHLPSNSHSEMVEQSGWRDNEPNRKTLVFEAEWSGNGEMPDAARLVRNHSECPSLVQAAILRHYSRLAGALKDAGELMAHFEDVKKFHDVWSAAMANGIAPDFSEVESFPGSIYVHQGATLTAPKLKRKQP